MNDMKALFDGCFVDFLSLSEGVVEKKLVTTNSGTVYETLTLNCRVTILPNHVWNMWHHIFVRNGSKLDADIKTVSQGFLYFDIVREYRTTSRHKGSICNVKDSWRSS